MRPDESALIEHIHRWAAAGGEPGFLASIARIVGFDAAGLISLEPGCADGFVLAAAGAAQPSRLIARSGAARARAAEAEIDAASGRLVPLGDGTEHSASAALVHRDENRALVLWLQAGGRSKPRARPAAERLVGRLFVHLALAVQVRERLDKAARELAAFKTMVSRSPMGVMLCDPDGRELFRNHAADRLLRAAERGGLEPVVRSASDGGDPQMLSSAIREALTRDARFHDGQEPYFLKIDRADGRCPYQLALRVIRDAQTVGGEEGFIMVSLHDPEAFRPIDGENIRALFGLTPAEARVCQLLFEGHKLKQIAAIAGVTTHTIKAHLRDCYRKLGVRSQAEVVHRLSLTVR